MPLDLTQSSSYALMIMGGNPSGEQQGNPIVSFLPFIFILLILYFLMIRPQKKKQKEHQEMVSSLAKGDKIVTAGGLHGTVQNTKEKSVILKISDNAKVEVERTAISSVVKSNNKAVAK